ncbi:hypothetical protein [Marivirga arenosa]|jgi:tyrosine-protein phosphatase YwqE|uniref:Uncharacterized protein n=1 Tax=Marivirga arenosa TaxID=3059076 RepID=A0AA49GD63_9BACT|nr:hypothetical protein [Marivirga sp. BKB1-2]WKK82791.1 hypothetical protein QYS47_12735 [Marivirga sp. BKB1-2]
MAKKKDTLKDLNDFMKNQSTDSKSEDQDYLSKKPTQLAEVEALKDEIKKMDELAEGSLSENEIASFIQKVADAHNISSRQVLYRVCEKVLENVKDREAADIMLENMVLYLKHQDLLLEKLKS